MLRSQLLEAADDLEAEAAETLSQAQGLRFLAMQVVPDDSEPSHDSILAWTRERHGNHYPYTAWVEDGRWRTSGPLFDSYYPTGVGWNSLLPFIKRNNVGRTFTVTTKTTDAREF